MSQAEAFLKTFTNTTHHESHSIDSHLDSRHRHIDAGVEFKRPNIRDTTDSSGRFIRLSYSGADRHENDSNLGLSVSKRY